VIVLSRWAVVGVFCRTFFTRRAVATFAAVTTVAVARAALTTLGTVLVGLRCLAFSSCCVVEWQSFWIAVLV
jgi:hypothetical protein